MRLVAVTVETVIQTAVAVEAIKIGTAEVVAVAITTAVRLSIEAELVTGLLVKARRPAVVVAEPAAEAKAVEPEAIFEVEAVEPEAIFEVEAVEPEAIFGVEAARPEATRLVVAGPGAARPGAARPGAARPGAVRPEAIFEAKTNISVAAEPMVAESEAIEQLKATVAARTVDEVLTSERPRASLMVPAEEGLAGQEQSSFPID